MPPVPTEQQSNYVRRLDGGGSGPAPSAKMPASRIAGKTAVMTAMATATASPARY